MINNLKYGTYEVVMAQDTFVLSDWQFVNKSDADKQFYKLVQEKDNFYNRVYMLEWAEDFNSWTCIKEWVYSKGYRKDDIRVKSKFKIIKQWFIKRKVLKRRKYESNRNER